MKFEEGKLTFGFPSHRSVARYEGWSFYRNPFQRVCGGSKTVDFEAIDGAKCMWLIEVKDYQEHPKTKVIDLADEFGFKVRDTLAGLVAAGCYANDDGERTFAKGAVLASKIRAI